MKENNKMMIERLKNEMQRAGVNARKLSDMANVGRSFVYDILNGKSCNPTTSKMSAIAEVLGVTVPYLISGTSNDNEIISRSGENFACVLSAYVATNKKNETIIATKPQSESHFFQRKWLETSFGKNINNLLVVQNEDESMEPTLKKGDHVLINSCSNFDGNAGMYVIFNGFNLIVKRIEQKIDSDDRQMVKISSDNKNYSNYDAELKKINIVGRLLWYSRSI